MHRSNGLLNGSSYTVLAACCLAASATGCRVAHTAPLPPLPSVTVAEVENHKIAEWDAFSGRFQAVDSVDIRPRVSGTVERVAFTEGSEVGKGQLLFQIDPRPYRAALKRAEAGLGAAESAALLATRSLERAKRLLAANATTRAEFDNRTAGAERASAAVSAAEAAVTSARLDLGWTQVRSPIRGRVGRAEITAGNLVQAGASRLTTVVSVDPIYVSFDAYELIYLRILAYRRSSPGARIPVVMGMADEDGRYPHRGYLDFIDNQLDPGTGTARARAVFDNKDRRFAPGLFARVEVKDSDEYLAPVINDRAVGTDQDRKFVLVLKDDGTVAYRPVVLGPLVGRYRVVKSGLKAHEKIVIKGLQRARPGSKVMATVGPMLATATATTPGTATPMATANP